MKLNSNFIIPADVPENKHTTFVKNYNAITRNTDRLFLFSCDHKIEHLNHDFYGKDISPEALHPEHMFRIASNGDIGAMATHLGLIARYAKSYPDVNYIVKANAAINTNPYHLSNSLDNKQNYNENKNNMLDPKSMLLCSIDDIIALKNDNKSLKIPGIGVTLYLGNEYETEMLANAAHIINKAHREGLVTIAWVYLRGKMISQENNPNLIAGAAGIGVSLGADFIKIKLPGATDILSSTQNLKIACAAAGNSKIIFSGGDKIEHEKYLHNLYDYIHNGDAAGTATGRNIFQLSLQKAIALTHAIATIVYKNSDYKTALAAYHAKLEKKIS